MTPLQIIGSAIVPSTFARIAGALGSESVRLEARSQGRVHDGPSRTRIDRMPEAERPPRVRDAPMEKTRSVLPSSVFESFLARERSLADRGTRRFSLLVLTRRAAAGSSRRGSDPLSELSSHKTYTRSCSVEVREMKFELC